MQEAKIHRGGLVSRPLHVQLTCPDCKRELIDDPSFGPVHVVVCVPEWAGNPWGRG